MMTFSLMEVLDDLQFLPRMLLLDHTFLLIMIILLSGKCLYEGVFVPCGIRSAERRKLNVLEMKSLRSLVGVSRMD